MLAKILTITVIVLIVGGALFYVIKSKKNGKKCIGCPYSGVCHTKKTKGKKAGQSAEEDAGCCNCVCKNEQNE